MDNRSNALVNVRNSRERVSAIKSICIANELHPTRYKSNEGGSGACGTDVAGRLNGAVAERIHPLKAAVACAGIDPG